MAFSEAEKYKIIRFLCLPGGVLTTTNINYSKIISDRLNDVPSGAETEARLILTSISNQDTKINAASGQAGVKSIDDIEFFEGRSDELRRERNRLVNELSSLLDIPHCCSFGSRMGNVRI